MRNRIVKIVFFLFFLGFEPTFSESCDVGHYASGDGGACVQCEPGKYQDEKGKTECHKCHSGTASNAKGLTSPCHACPKGRYADRDGMQECNKCSEGQYNKHPKRTVCDKCMLGRASNITGRDTQCDVCEPGRFAGIGWKECELCPLGTHALYEKTEDSNKPVSRCPLCARGHYMDEPGYKKEECKICVPGTVTNLAGQAECESCGPGTYSPLGNLFECLDCRVGQYNSEKRAVSCKMCVAGKYADKRGQTECKTCPKGYFTTGQGMPFCSKAIAQTSSSRTKITTTKITTTPEAAVDSAGTYYSLLTLPLTITFPLAITFSLPATA